MSGFSVSDNDMDLPPGFRFHPTDEELITHYLTPKVLDTMFSAAAIGEVDLNSVEPWDLPWKAKMGEKEWYFFCVRDRKYPTGMRTNRATFAGYWKATGKDKEIFKAKRLVGMKKTLVFYKGRAPRGEKTSWVMHEFYRLEGMQNNLPKTAKNEWVICRVFKKSSGGKKIPISSLIKSENCGENSKMPPLMDISQASHVPCFSNSVEDEKRRNSESSGALSNHQLIMPELGVDSGMMMMQDHSILKLLLGNNQNSEVGLRPCDDDDDQQFLITSAAGAVDLDCLWNYHY